MTYTFSIVNELFGKPAENLSCSDIKALVESGVPESLRLEFKAVPEDIAERKLIEITIKSIVGFLNSDIGRGLLILGIKGKERAEELTCIPRMFLGASKDIVTSKLRNWIFSYLDSIPPMVSPPRLFIKIFSCEECGLRGYNGWIALIAVERAFDALYYSKADDTAYQRRGNETKRLSLEEVIRIVEAKRQPLVIVLMSPIKREENGIHMGIDLYNLGTKPANSVASIITIDKEAKLGKILLKVKPYALTRATSISLKVLPYRGERTIKYHENAKTMSFQVSGQIPFFLPVFPKMHSTTSNRVVLSYGKRLPKDSSLLIRFIAKTCTETNNTFQECYSILNLSSNEYHQFCTYVLVKDYMERILLEISLRKGKYLKYNEKEGVKIESLSET